MCMGDFLRHQTSPGGENIVTIEPLQWVAGADSDRRVTADADTANKDKSIGWPEGKNTKEQGCRLFLRRSFLPCCDSGNPNLRPVPSKSRSVSPLLIHGLVAVRCHSSSIALTDQPRGLGECSVRDRRCATSANGFHRRWLPFVPIS